jgi:hypothetical protein
MLNRLNAYMRLIWRTDARRHPRVGNGRAAHRNIDRLGQVNATKHNTCVRSSRAQAQLDTLAAMYTNAGSFDDRFDGSLQQHSVIL